VDSFEELAAARFTDGVNALCWERKLPGDFGEVVNALETGEGSCSDLLIGQDLSPVLARHSSRNRGEDGIVTVDEVRLRGLRLGAEGKAAVEVILEDLRRLRELERDPVLNCIHGYPRDEEAGPVATDVFSFHADSAPVEADTWLCTYHGSPSEGLSNEEALRRVDVPETRAELLKQYGGADDAGFAEFLHEHCYDLHYAALTGARPYSFGVFNLWRIAVDWPGSPVPPCVHRAPATIAGEPRLMVIC
jgi:hypothetical protein